MTEKIRVLIADDHPIVRRGLRTVLRTQPDMELVGEAENGAQATRLIREQAPDIALLDLQMPQQDGLAVIEEVTRAHIPTRVVLLTSFPDDERVIAALRAGATGILLKDSPPRDLLDALRRVAQGETVLHPAIATRMLMEIKQPRQALDDLLTLREKQVLSLLALGMTNTEIAEQLAVSVRTVTAHIRAILDKLHLTNRTQAALFAQEKGLAQKH